MAERDIDRSDEQQQPPAPDPTKAEHPPLPAEGAVSSPVGHGPPAESGAGPATAITSAPGEATAEAARRKAGTPPRPREVREPEA